MPKPDNTEELRRERLDEILKAHAKWSYSNGQQGSNEELHFYNLKSIDELKQAINALIEAELTEARIDELERLERDSCIPPDCPEDCEEPDPKNPRENHWHHTVRTTISRRLAELNKGKQS